MPVEATFCVDFARCEFGIGRAPMLWCSFMLESIRFRSPFMSLRRPRGEFGHAEKVVRGTHHVGSELLGRSVCIELACDQKDCTCANDTLLIHGDVAVRE